MIIAYMHCPTKSAADCKFIVVLQRPVTLRESPRLAWKFGIRSRRHLDHFRMISRNDTKTSLLLFPQYSLFKNTLIIPSDPISCRNELRLRSSLQILGVHFPKRVARHRHKLRPHRPQQPHCKPSANMKSDSLLRKFILMYCICDFSHGYFQPSEQR